MRDIAWRLGFTLGALALLALFGPSVGCGLGNQIVEQVLSQTPKRQIDHFLDAAAQGDRQTALALWMQPGQENESLSTRRETIVDQLFSYGPDLDAEILEIEWRTTCCEPGVVDSQREAGGATVRVSVVSERKALQIYTFDLRVPDGYWGGAMGYPVRKWAIVDVYPESEIPHTWSLR